MMKLPDTWTIRPLKDVSLGCEQRIPEDNEEFIYVDIASVDREYKIINKSQKLLGRNAPSRARKVINTGDVLVALTRPNLNTIAIVPENLNGQIASTGFEILRAPDLDPRWLFFIVQTSDFINQMSDKVQGSLYPSIKSKDVLDFNAPFAPLNEQKRISDKLESLLAKIDRCRERFNSIGNHIKLLRQLVLEAAISGKLTQDWRKTVAAENSWERVKLADIGELGRGKSRHRPRNDSRLYGGPYPFIQTGDIAQSLGNITHHSQTYTEFGLAQSKLWPTDTVCITISANIADTAILTYPACFPDSVAGFIPNKDKVLPKFIKWSIDVIRKNLEDFAPSTAQKNISLFSLNEIEFVCPPLNEQFEIIRRVEKFFMLADKVEGRCLSSTEQLGNLVPTILAKAFSGNFVERNQNDEPASELLDRVLARKKMADNQPKKKNRISKKTVVMATLEDVIAKAGDWIDADEAFRQCGITDSSDTDQIEMIFAELRILDKQGRLSTESVLDESGRKWYDRLKLITKD